MKNGLIVLLTLLAAIVVAVSGCFGAVAEVNHLMHGPPQSTFTLAYKSIIGGSMFWVIAASVLWAWNNFGPVIKAFWVLTGNDVPPAVNAAGDLIGSAGKVAVAIGKKALDAAGVKFPDPNQAILDIKKVLADHGITDQLEEIVVKAGGMIHTLKPPQVQVQNVTPPVPNPIQAKPGA